jgi:hypothetical protein
MRNGNYENTETAKGEVFAADQVVPKMDAKHSERPFELDGMVITELLGGAVSRAASRSWNMIEATRGAIREIEA